MVKYASIRKNRSQEAGKMLSDPGKLVSCSRRITLRSTETTVFTLFLSFVLIFTSSCTKASVHDPGDDIVVSEFSSDFHSYSSVVDINFSKSILDDLSGMGSDPVMGFRSAGSQAERDAAEMVAQAMIKAGLSHVTREETPVTGWTFTGAAINYTDFKGVARELPLGGYPVNMIASKKSFILTDLGKGTAFDYVEKDVAGKLVLIDSDPALWNVGYPVYQAKLKGAGAVLVRTPAADDSTLITQDLYGVTGIPVFAISGADAAALRRDMRLGDNVELSVTLTAESKVFPDPERPIARGNLEDEAVGSGAEPAGATVTGTGQSSVVSIMAGAEPAGAAGVSRGQTPVSSTGTGAVPAWTTGTGLGQSSVAAIGAGAVPSGVTGADTGQSSTSSAGAGSDQPEKTAGDGSAAISTETGETAYGSSKRSRTVNVWGEIPGRTDDVIYIIGNYDGFYNSVFYNTAGAATLLGIAKALIDSEYTPVKTIRFVAYGAGEWGSSDSVLQRGTGALSQLTMIHPDWPESAFAVIAVEGGHPLGNSTNFGVNVSEIIYPFVKRSADELINTGYYSYSWYKTPERSGIGTQDIIWELFGVPVVASGMVAPSVSSRTASPSASFRTVSPAASSGGVSSAAFSRNDRQSAAYFHSNKDTAKDLGFSDDAFLFNHLLYGKLLIDLDKSLIRPIDLASLFRSFLTSYTSMPPSLRETVVLAEKNAETLKSEIEKMNEEYLESYETMRESMEIMSYSLNRELYKLNRDLSSAFISLDRNGHMMYTQEAALNYLALFKYAEKLLEAHDSAGAINVLSKLDRGGYALDFDAAVYTFFNDADSAAKQEGAQGVRLQDPCKVEELIRGIDADMRDGSTDFLVSMERIRTLTALWEETLREISATESAAANEANRSVEMLLEDYFSE